jgi:hypothetical protein
MAYFRPSFLNTTESVGNERLPFLTGMGGYLQLLLYGVAGLDLLGEGPLQSQWACLPEGLDGVTLRGVCRRGGRHEIFVTCGPDGTVSVAIQAAD